MVGVPCEGVGVEELVPSLETQEKQTFSPA